MKLDIYKTKAYFVKSLYSARPQSRGDSRLLNIKRLMKLFKKSFFEGDTVKVAEALLGSYLIRKSPEGRLLKGRIVETEAYLGKEDPSCHSFGGRKTARTQTMYLSGGYAYVYFTYGMHHCLNVVTAGAGEPEAVLIRALEPVQGFKEMEKNRNTSDRKNLTTGPGKLCRAFAVSRELNGAALWKKGSLYIEPGEFKTSDPAIDRRIGLSPYSEAFYWPLRFYIKSSPYVSVGKNLLD